MLNLIVSNSVILLQSRIYSQVCMLYYITSSNQVTVYWAQLAKSSSVFNQVQVRILSPKLLNTNDMAFLQ